MGFCFWCCSYIDLFVCLMHVFHNICFPKDILRYWPKFNFDEPNILSAYRQHNANRISASTDIRQKLICFTTQFDFPIKKIQNHFIFVALYSNGQKVNGKIIVWLSLTKSGNIFFFQLVVDQRTGNCIEYFFYFFFYAS